MAVEKQVFEIFSVRRVPIKVYSQFKSSFRAYVALLYSCRLKIKFILSLRSLKLVQVIESYE